MLQGKRRGIHFSDEELLVYLQQRKQEERDELWYIQDQHVTNCQECRGRVASLKQSEQLMTRALRSRFYGSYEPITASVMQRIGEPRPARFSRHKGYVIALPVVIMLATLGIFLVSAFLVNGHLSQTAGTTGTSTHASPVAGPTQVHVVQQPTAVPTIAPTAVPPMSTVAPTPIPAASMVVSNCTTSLDQALQHLRICGNNFIAGDKVVFTITYSGSKAVKRVGPVQVQSDGTFVQNLTIHSCRDVPTTIFAQDVSATSELYTTLATIHYGTCS
jgi:hypothetical protein